jgi:hypothetical protein
MRRWSRQLVIVLSCLLCLPSAALAALGDPSMYSTSYGVVESEVGGSGCDPVISGSFCGSSTDYTVSPVNDDGGSTLGESAVGNSSSASYQTNSGYNTTAQPGLVFFVQTGTVSLGQLSTSVPTTATATFSIRDYTSSGYKVYIVGNTPTYGSHSLTKLAADAGYVANNEEFGINLVANTSPSWTYGNFGAGATCQAVGFCSGVSGDGSTNNYIQNGKFRFNSGEAIASSTSSSGETDYTMSFMAGISTLTPAGSYQGSLSLVAVGQY